MGRSRCRALARVVWSASSTPIRRCWRRRRSVTTFPAKSRRSNRCWDSTFVFTPANHKDEPLYFSQRIGVPAIEADAKGEAYLQGGFDLGEGKYHVDWLMRD